MSFEYINNPKGLKIVKKIIKDRFALELTDKDVRTFLKKLEEGTQEKYKDVAGFSHSKINPFFFGGENLDNIIIFFSPNTIFSQMSRIIKKDGLESFKQNGKYQMIREMIIASYVTIGLKKRAGIEAYIAVNDSPDIILAFMSKRPWGEGPLNILRAEILQIHPHIRRKWGNSLNDRIIEFAVNKKCLKRYSQPTGLIIGVELKSGDNLEFEKEKMQNMIKTSKLQEVFDFIIVVLYMLVGGKNFTTSWIYPDIGDIYVQLDQEENLLY